MKPVDQNAFGPEKGNCFSACVASILELPIDDVPQFMTSENWWHGFARWCARQGYLALVDYRVPDEPATLGYSILGGESPRHPGSGHAVVALDGVMVHDPHPDRTGLVGEPWHNITLECIHISSPAKEEA
jgi:hypothetical protein